MTTTVSKKYQYPEYAKAWRRDNKARLKSLNQIEHRVRKYGLTDEQFKRLLAVHDYRCACCGEAFGQGRRITVDHDHATSQIRGIVCLQCNTMLGHARDETRRLQCGIAYLARAAAGERTFIVGIGVKARHGKDTLASMLHARLPESRLYTFAGALKAWCRVQGWMKEKDPRLLQIVGTEVFRRLDPDVWVNALCYQIAEEKPAVAILSDMRFPNELAFVRQYGIGVRVTRLNADGSIFISPDRAADHPSEIALDVAEFDYEYVAQSGDLAPLREAANVLLEKVTSCLRTP